MTAGPGVSTGTGTEGATSSQATSAYVTVDAYYEYGDQPGLAIVPTAGHGWRVGHSAPSWSRHPLVQRRSVGVEARRSSHIRSEAGSLPSAMELQPESPDNKL